MQPKSKKQQLLITIYRILWTVRYGVLMTVFGAVSHCNQTPSCGTFFLDRCEKDGFLRAIVQTIPRVLRCGLPSHHVHGKQLVS